MKAVSAELEALLDSTTEFVMADCFTITLRTGQQLFYTSADVPVTLSGTVFLASSVRVSGLKFKCAIGVDVDEQDITILAGPNDLVNGVPFLSALRQGVFDGAYLQRDRAYLTAWNLPALGGITLFHGRISTLDKVGRVAAQLKVKSDLVLLDIDMPRNIYQAACLHTLYDSGCGIARSAHTVSGTVGTGSTVSSINWSDASVGVYDQGILLFTSGPNAGVQVTVKSTSAGNMQLIYPLESVPDVGDAFTVSAGCDHSLATCQSKFSNQANFRGFPFVPAAETAY